MVIFPFSQIQYVCTDVVMCDLVWKLQVCNDNEQDQSEHNSRPQNGKQLECSSPLLTVNSFLKTCLLRKLQIPIFKKIFPDDVSS